MNILMTHWSSSRSDVVAHTAQPQHQCAPPTHSLSHSSSILRNLATLARSDHDDAKPTTIYHVNNNVERRLAEMAVIPAVSTAILKRTMLCFA